MDRFRPFWKGKLSFNPSLGFFLILIFGIPRFLLVLHANSGGNYSGVSLLFLLMCLMPFLLLNRAGRKEIGLTSVTRSRWLAWAVIAGIVTGLLVFIFGWTFYGLTADNWFVYIGQTYKSAFPPETALSQTSAFIILAGVAITFSPFGEEIMYRGLIHQCFVPTFGDQIASRIDSLAFALTHLAHFGILYLEGKWEFHVWPALLWVGCMYGSARLFFLCRQKGESILTAILCHAGFNLAMTYIIWYHILE